MAQISQTQAGYYGASSGHGAYQFTSLRDIINAFLVIYVGEDKLISKISKTDVRFHAQRALQELSFDTLKSVKSLEIEVPSTLQMSLPQDYVNYVKITRTDSSGIERVLYPAINTSNPTAPLQTGSIGDEGFIDANADGAIDLQSESDTWTAFKGQTGSNVGEDAYNFDTDLFDLFLGQRYGINPANAQINGTFYIDELNGKIHFGSSIAGKTVTVKYISDSLGTDAESRVHKFAEEAMYKCIAYAVVANRANMPEYVVQRLKKEKKAATRQAKLRLSNIKLEEISQILRGKSKQIKH